MRLLEQIRVKIFPSYLNDEIISCFKTTVSISFLEWLIWFCRNLFRSPMHRVLSKGRPQNYNVRSSTSGSKFYFGNRVCKKNQHFCFSLSGVPKKKIFHKQAFFNFWKIVISELRSRRTVTDCGKYAEMLFFLCTPFILHTK